MSTLTKLAILAGVYYFFLRGKKDKVEMSLDELISEHQRLVDLLKSSTRPEDKEEFLKQQAELEGFIKQKAKLT